MGLFDKLLKVLRNEVVENAAEKAEEEQPEAYFADIFARHFPEYEIRRNVTVVNTAEQNVPVTFMFMKNDRPVYAVILCYSQIYNRKRILNTMEACSRQGIPVHRYFEDFRNEETYVCKRIRSVLE